MSFMEHDRIWDHRAQKEVAWSPQARDLGFRPRPSDCGVWSLHCTLSLCKVLSSLLQILACFFLGGLEAKHVPVNLAVSGPACCLPQPDQLVPVIGSGAPAPRQAQPQAEARAQRQGTARASSHPSGQLWSSSSFCPSHREEASAVLDDSRGNFASGSRT